jgi:hypothetical protein
MAEWTVTPSEGVEDKGDGKFKFPANTTYCSKTYTVKYNSNGCTCDQKVYVRGKAVPSNYTEYGISSLVTDTTDCTAGTVYVSANVPATSHTFTINADCKGYSESTSAGTEYKTVGIYVSRNCSTSSDIYEGVEEGVNYKITQSGNCGYEGKCPINNCATGTSCEEGSGCDGHMSVSPSGSSWSTPFGQDSFEISSDYISVDTSSNISYSIVQKTGGKTNNGWYKIEFTGSKSEWEKYKSGDTVGWYDVSCTKSGYCGYHNKFRIYVKKS